ncbi:hypothetical protein A2U01_0023423 [Trifolium medium]|uniref:Uncharacterized protein n=1 Tax=Trifolium medium TaxID=97028 RepID=A0A392NRB3_9FABA|nr:hypothetical protein [Trifolium medium]
MEGIWRFAPFNPQQQNFSLPVARRAKWYGELRRQDDEATLTFWKLRVAQDRWRGAPLNQETQKFCSGSCALRRMVWRGAPLKIQTRTIVTVSCASCRIVGAARQHGIL